MRATIMQPVRKKPSMNDYENYLTHTGPPDHDHPQNGGRVPWSGLLRYGSWLRRHDRIAFDVGYQEYLREKGFSL